MNFRLRAIEATSLDPSRVLFILPSEGEATAEDLAMLQALYSRDPRPIDSSIKLAKATASGEFMKQFYVGYGHDSIADCGMVLIAIENVPMLIAKMIQHYQLYKGQESSTRYLDFSVQPFVAHSSAGRMYQNKLRMFYKSAMEPQLAHMSQMHGLDLKDPVQKKAARSAAFDVLRGFLPIGALTNLSWYVDLRNLNEHLHTLDFLAERMMMPDLKAVVLKIRALATEEFPNSITAEPRQAPVYEDWHYGENRQAPGYTFTARKLSTYSTQMSCEWGGLIDFASWRDLARHRSVFQTFPHIGVEYGFHDWYTRFLAPDLRGKGQELVAECPGSDIYAIPMGMRVPYFCQGLQRKFEYMAALRSSATVHPTLRAEAIRMGSELIRRGASFKLNTDAGWTVGPKRASQDILKKQGVV